MALETNVPCCNIYYLNITHSFFFHIHMQYVQDSFLHFPRSNSIQKSLNLYQCFNISYLKTTDRKSCPDNTKFTHSLIYSFTPTLQAWYLAPSSESSLKKKKNAPHVMLQKVKSSTILQLTILHK